MTKDAGQFRRERLLTTIDAGAAESSVWTEGKSRPMGRLFLFAVAHLRGRVLPAYQRMKSASSRMIGSGMPISQSSAPLPKLM
jgi:hypothetical protein